MTLAPCFVFCCKAISMVTMVDGYYVCGGSKCYTSYPGFFVFFFSLHITFLFSFRLLPSRLLSPLLVTFRLVLVSKEKTKLLFPKLRACLVIMKKRGSTLHVPHQQWLPHRFARDNRLTPLRPLLSPLLFAIMTPSLAPSPHTHTSILFAVFYGRACVCACMLFLLIWLVICKRDRISGYCRPSGSVFF